MKILVSALEPSSNLHLTQIMSNSNNIEICGIFDSSLGSPIVDSNRFGVMGIVDVLSKIKLAKDSIKRLVELVESCDKVLLIDAPAFNIPLAKAIKESYPSKEIIYYILPTVWIWKKSRIKIVERYTDIQACIFPFELKFWQNGRYVGNPILDEVDTVYRPKKDTFAFMPGSRASEIRANMPIFRKLNIEGRKIVVIPKGIDRSIYGDLSGFEISDNTYKTLSISSFAFICSGTATLEAAIIGVPFILVYKAKWIDWIVANLFIKIKFVGLANIILDKKLHPELLQKDFNEETLYREYINFDYENYYSKSKEIKDILKFGSSKNIVRILTGI
jgi:lipid-A-disaccharide synthase